MCLSISVRFTHCLNDLQQLSKVGMSKIRHSTYFPWVHGERKPKQGCCPGGLLPSADILSLMRTACFARLQGDGSRPQLDHTSQASLRLPEVGDRPPLQGSFRPLRHALVRAAFLPKTQHATTKDSRRERVPFGCRVQSIHVLWACACHAMPPRSCGSLSSLPSPCAAGRYEGCRCRSWQ